MKRLASYPKPAAKPNFDRGFARIPRITRIFYLAWLVVMPVNAVLWHAVEIGCGPTPAAAGDGGKCRPLRGRPSLPECVLMASSGQVGKERSFRHLSLVQIYEKPYFFVSSLPLLWQLSFLHSIGGFKDLIKKKRFILHPVNKVSALKI
jgi:hypothetical protein